MKHAASTAIVAFGFFLATSSHAEAPPPAGVRSAPEVPLGAPANIAALARSNTDYRRVIFSAQRMQIALMSIPPGGDIGEEQHQRVEQVVFAVEGEGTVIIDGVESPFRPGDVVFLVPGVRHNFFNTGKTPLKLYTLYAPPNHLPGRVQATKAAAQADVADEAFGQKVQ